MPRPLVVGAVVVAVVDALAVGLIHNHHVHHPLHDRQIHPTSQVVSVPRPACVAFCARGEGQYPFAGQGFHGNYLFGGERS